MKWRETKVVSVGWLDQQYIVRYDVDRWALIALEIMRQQTEEIIPEEVAMLLYELITPEVWRKVWRSEGGDV